MRWQQCWVLLVVCVPVASLFITTRATAYCQTTTSEQQVSSCTDTCVTDGYPLAWPKSDVTYVFNNKGFPGFSDTILRRIFRDAFGAWGKVTCDGKPVGLKLAAATGTTSLTVGPEELEPNDSVIAHLDRDEWAALPADPNAFALTAIWYDANNGRILGADMHFNGGMDPFRECPASGCSLGQPGTDLLNVATHEAGHFLGLAHSERPEATMWCDAQGNEVDKRSLASDDERGICAVYPPGLAFTPDYFPPSSPGSGEEEEVKRLCSMGVPAAGSDAGSVWLLAAFLGLAVRRARR